MPAKDVPILLAAIDSGAKYLLTGDKDHFGVIFGRAGTRHEVFIAPSAATVQ